MTDVFSPMGSFRIYRAANPMPEVVMYDSPMRFRVKFAILIPITAAIVLVALQFVPQNPPVTKSPASSVQLINPKPLVFEENRGQFDPDVSFLARGDGFNLYLMEQQAVLTPSSGKFGFGPGEPLVFSLIGSNSQSRPQGEELLAGKTNYLVGNRADKWLRNLPNFEKIRLESVYNGIDLIYYGNDRNIEFDFKVAPGADPDLIRLDIRGSDGLLINDAGDLVVGRENGSFTFQSPRIYQEINGTRRSVSGSFALVSDYLIGFDIGEYDRTRPLVIDPVLLYATYIGGDGHDTVLEMFVDDNHDMILVGSTSSGGFPAGADLYTLGAQKLYVTRLVGNGSGFVYTTFFGGRSTDVIREAKVDQHGNVYMTGYTESDDFPTKNAYQTGLSGGESSDAFVVKLKPDGSDFVYSTYLGGWYGSGGFADDQATDIDIDGEGNAYVTGWTQSMFFDTTAGAFQTIPGIEQDEYNGATDAFVSKFDPNGALVYSTYLGGLWKRPGYPEPELDGSKSDKGTAIAVDRDGSVFVAGLTNAALFPKSSGTYRETLEGASPNLFITRLNPKGSDVLYSTFFGGSQASEIHDMVVDHHGRLILGGFTLSPDFPIGGGEFQTNFGGVADLPAGYEGWQSICGDGFLTIFQNDLTAFIYSTFCGGSSRERIRRVAVDDIGNIYATGFTFSPDFPITHDAIQDTLGGLVDAFVVKIDPEGRFIGETLDYASYFGGRNLDSGNDIAVDSDRNMYMAGWTRSSDLPVTENALQDTLEGSLMPNNEPFGDAFVAKMGNKDYIRFARVYPDPVNDLWLSHTLRPGAGWQFNSSVQYALFASNRGTINILIEDDKGNILDSRELRDVPAANGLFYNDIRMNKIIVPQIEDSDSLFLKAFLTPDNQAAPIDSAVIAYKIVVHDWTFMIYMNGDGNLEKTAIDDLAEMAQVGSNDSLAIVVLLDRHPGYYDGWGNWSDSRYIAVRENGIKQQSMGELDMGHPGTLLNFINWGEKNFPAHQYALVMWDHGGGWKLSNRTTLNKALPAPQFPLNPPGVPDDYEASFDFGPDETNNNKLLGNEIGDALRRIPKLDILFFNTCVYALIENAYNFRYYADFYIASQDFMPLPSMPYKVFLQRLKERPEMTRAEVGQVAVATYGDSYSENRKNITLSCSYMYKAEQIAAEVSYLATLLIEKQPWDAIDSALVKTHYYPPKHFRDLYHFAENLKLETSDPDIQVQCDRIMGSIQDAVVANYASRPEEGSHGLSIYFPISIGAAHPWYFNTKYYEFAEKNQWDDFLLLYLFRKNLPPGVEGPIVDSYEVNNTFSQAYGPLESEEEYISYIPYAGDEDFYFFTTGLQTSVTVKLTSPQGINYDLTVMDANQQIIASSNSTEAVDSLYIASVLPGSYYLQIITNGNFIEFPYKLEVAYNGGHVGQVPLSFDDGSPTEGMYSGDAGEVIGSNFRAPLYPMKLDEVSFYLTSLDGGGTGGDGSFYLWLADFYGTKIEPFKITPSGLRKSNPAQAGGWFTVNLADKDITLQSDFFIGVGYDGENTPALGMDNFDDGRAFHYDDSTQTWQALPKTVFIRAKAGYMQSPHTVDFLMPEEYYVLPGHEFSISVSVADLNESSIDSLEMEISFDPKMLNLSVLDFRDLLHSNWEITKLDTSLSGRINLKTIGASPISEEKRIFVMTFRANSSAALGDSSDIILQRVIANGGQIFTTTTNTKIHIGEISRIEDNSANMPEEYRLYQNYPNPFNPSTTIAYYVPRSDHVRITVRDVLGRHIRTLINENISAGHHTTGWDGLDESGRPVAAGVFFCTMEARSFTQTIKTAFVK